MKIFHRMAISLAIVLAITGCGSTAPPKFENGQYVPPPAKNALRVELTREACDGSSPALVAGLAPLAITAGSAVISQSYDRFINWLEEKQANLSASSTGISSTSFLASKQLKRCLKLTRADSLMASFSISR